MTQQTDTIGGFPCASSFCGGCNKPLLLENAWMDDGCPCHSRLGINSMNETRWGLLMLLQRQKSYEVAAEGEICMAIIQEFLDAFPECRDSVPNTVPMKSMRDASMRDAFDEVYRRLRARRVGTR